MFKFTKFAPLAVAATLACGSIAQATTNPSTTMTVFAQVPETCSSFSAGDMVFPNITSSSTAPVEATATLSFTCTAAPAGQIFLGATDATDASGGACTMVAAGGTSTIPFYLSLGTYYNASGSSPLSCAPSTFNGPLPAITGSAQTVTIYGSIPTIPSPLVSGLYTDNVTLQIND
jgi:Spore Coat Protein U domain